jgi:TolB-like protein
MLPYGMFGPLKGPLRWPNFGLPPGARDTLDFRFGDCEIDVARHEFRRGGEIVPIEPQVFDILLHLIRNCDRIVSKEELIDTIWHGRVISEAALSSRVAATRRAIGDNGDDQLLIRTFHKRGFRFIGHVDRIAPAHGPLSAAPAQQLTAVDNSRKGAATGEPKTPPTLKLPDKPSIAVLPFENMSGDAEQDYFAHGLAEDIITGLSQQRWFFVIARNSSFAFKGEAVDVRKVAKELGVRYVLEGSVRKAADRVRVTAQLIDASDGIHLWADRYDRHLANIFELQDEITNKVIDSVGPQIIVAEAARVRHKPPHSIGSLGPGDAGIASHVAHDQGGTGKGTRVAAAGDRSRRRICPRARTPGMDVFEHVQS